MSSLKNIDDYRDLANRIIDLIEVTDDKEEKETLKTALNVVLARINRSKERGKFG